MQGRIGRLITAALLGAHLLAGAISRSPQEVGEVLLKEMAIRDGKVILRVDSGGCTDTSSIRPRVRLEPGPAGQIPRYTATFERVRPDDCKAFLLEGVELEYRIVEDLGIKGAHILTLTNPLQPAGSPAASRSSALQDALLASTLQAIQLETKGYEERLKTAEGGTGPAGNVERFKGRLVEMKELLAKFQTMAPGEYPMPMAESPEPLLQEPGYGPVVPARLRTFRVTVKAPLKAGALLEVPGTSRSGPFFHLAGGDTSRMKPGRAYEVTAYLVYRREYAGLITDHYVHVAAVK